MQKLQVELAPGEQQPRAATPAGPSLSFTDTCRVTGLSRVELGALIKAGNLTTVTVGRAAEVTTASLRRWATGFRPDLLDALGALDPAGDEYDVIDVAGRPA